jgi:hypothetical protein
MLMIGAVGSNRPMTKRKPRTRPSQLSANAKYQKSRLEAGMKKVTTWLSPESLAALDELKLTHGSKDAAIQQALLDELARVRAEEVDD